MCCVWLFSLQKHCKHFNGSVQQYTKNGSVRCTVGRTSAFRQEYGLVWVSSAAVRLRARTLTP